MKLIEKQNTFLLIVVTFKFALFWLSIVIKTKCPLSNIEMKKYIEPTARCCFNHLSDLHIEIIYIRLMCICLIPIIAVRWLL